MVDPMFEDIQQWMMEERMAMAATRPHAHILITGYMPSGTPNGVLANLHEIAKVWVDDACAQWYAEQRTKHV